MFDYTEKILHIWQRGGKWSLNLKEQIYMLSLERHSNITRAAKELGISQPALTTFLNHLEKDLDVKLFDRSAVPMKLTPAGELYINKAKKMLCIKEEFDRELQVLNRNFLNWMLFLTKIMVKICLICWKGEKLIFYFIII